MHEDDKELGQMLESVALSADAPPDRMEAVHEEVMRIAAIGGRRHGAYRNTTIAAVVVVGVTAIGLAGTQTGRDLVWSLLTRIEPAHTISGEHRDGSAWSVTRSGPGTGPFSSQEAEEANTKMDEIATLKQAGEGRLVGILEVPGVPGQPGAEKILTVYQIEYTFSSGETTTVGDNGPSVPQRARMRLDEITKLRDAGAGEIRSREDFPMGLGKYVIRFTLPGGEQVDVETVFPPATRAEREAIFAEIAELKAARLFAVLDADRAPGQPVSGMLRYTLADGRVVGVAETIPADVISADGEHVISPMSHKPTQGQNQTGGMTDEVVALKEAGQGRRVGLLEAPGIPGQPGADKIFMIYQIEYTLSNGEKTLFGDNGPSAAQMARMRLDELRKLRDAGEGEIVSQTDFPMGLGKYVIRFALADGEMVEVQTIFPPAPRSEREAIFAEIRQLKQARRFSVLNADRTPDGRVSGLVRYTLADGRVAGVAETIPVDVISADGEYVVSPLSNEPTKIQDQDGGT